VEDEKCHAASGKPDDEALEGADYTLLLVEDDMALREITAKVLRQYGYNVITASDGRTALEMAERQTPDLILLDVLLPGLNGYEVCLRLKSGTATRPIPVILVTVIDPAKGAEEGFLVGADDYLAKPVNAAELRVRIKTMLRIQKLRESAPVIAAIAETAESGNSTADAPQDPPALVDWSEFTRKLVELENARADLKRIFHRHLQAHFHFWMMSGKNPEEKKAAFATAMDWLATEVFNPEKVFHLKNGTKTGKEADAGAADRPVHYFDVVDDNFLLQLHADARLKLAGRLNLPVDLLGELVRGTLGRREAVARAAWEELFTSTVSGESVESKADPKACVAAPGEGFNLDDIRFAFFSQISILAGLTDYGE
jgi:DNA-binding response OmpR family regulator